LRQSSLQLSTRRESLTTAPAELFGLSASGKVAAGYDADLVVLTADPAMDVRAFADVALTLRKGAVVYESE
jgi:imidazolonepropionase-like amidohydrolase